MKGWLYTYYKKRDFRDTWLLRTLSWFLSFVAEKLHRLSWVGYKRYLVTYKGYLLWHGKFNGDFWLSTMVANNNMTIDGNKRMTFEDLCVLTLISNSIFLARGDITIWFGIYGINFELVWFNKKILILGLKKAEVLLR